MKITKYDHACVVIEEQGKRLVIDPGDFTPEFGGAEDVIAVVITHVHDDHYGAKNVQKIIAANPGVIIYTTQEVADALRDATIKVIVPEVYEDYTTEPFALRFFGEQHAELYRNIPRPQNIGVLVNGTFYYPGDSFTPPDHEVAVLAIPSGAGWMKLSEAIDFMQAVEPKQVFPTHDISLSDVGRAWAGGLLEKAAGEQNAAFTPLKSGESIDV